MNIKIFLIIKTNTDFKINQRDYIEKMLANYNKNNTKITRILCINTKLED